MSSNPLPAGLSNPFPLSCWDCSAGATGWQGQEDQLDPSMHPPPGTPSLLVQLLGEQGKIIATQTVRLSSAGADTGCWLSASPRLTRSRTM
jgi:hypothetical protein